MKEDTGWGLDNHTELNDVLTDISDMRYEILNCVRGCLTGCHIYKELGQYMCELSDKLEDIGIELINKKE